MLLNKPAWQKFLIAFVIVTGLFACMADIYNVYLPQVPYLLDTSGAANTITLNGVVGIHPTATIGDCITMKLANLETAATTINVTPLGGTAYSGIPLKKRITSGVADPGATGDFISGGIYKVCYDGTNFVAESTSGQVYTGGALSGNSMLRGNSANQAQGSTGIVSTNGTGFTTYNSEASLPTPGLLYLKGVTSQKAETISPDTGVLSVTPASAIGTYHLTFVEVCTAMSAAVIGWTATWTDSGTTAQAPTNLALYQTGVAAPALTFTSSVPADYYGSMDIDVSAAGTAIVIKTTSTGTSATCKVSASVHRIQ